MIRALAIAAVLAGLPGCHEIVELDPATDGGGEDAARDSGADATTCAPAGEACDRADACCSGVCGGDARCAARGCVPIGGACAAAAECCSVSCVDGLCRSSGTCAPAGESCTSGAQCCSGACADDGSGRVVCQRLGGCTTAGEVCTRDADCCGAAGGSCVREAAAALGRCAEPSGCAPAGEVCRVAGDPSATRECCGSGSMGPGVCRRSASADADRCTSTLVSTMCVPEGEPCAAPEECCAGSCVPEGGALVCRSMCRAAGASCTRAADCCGGACEGGLCATTSTTCAPLGASCASASECCSSYCWSDVGVCASPPI